MENDRENSFFHILILYRFLPFLSPYLLAHTFCLLYQTLHPCKLTVMLQTLDFPFLQYTTCCIYDIVNKHTTTNNIYQFQLIHTATCFNQNFGYHLLSMRVGTLIVATIYLQLIQNRYMFQSFTVLHCSHQHCVQPFASDVEVVGYL